MSQPWGWHHVIKAAYPNWRSSSHTHTHTHTYDKDERPELFAYFVQGGSGQVLDNAHGNVYFGVANGTACTMHSFAWDDLEDKEDAHNAIRTSTPGQVIDLPKPPDHIIVDIKPVKGIKWPQGLNHSPNLNLI